jgi:hypothetical protein
MIDSPPTNGAMNPGPILLSLLGRKESRLLYSFLSPQKGQETPVMVAVHRRRFLVSGLGARKREISTQPRVVYQIRAGMSSQASVPLVDIWVIKVLALGEIDFHSDPIIRVG